MAPLVGLAHAAAIAHTHGEMAGAALFALCLAVSAWLSRKAVA